jgi:Ni/Fe-hydrogenase 1 B-type cytochrome subunit
MATIAGPVIKPDDTSLVYGRKYVWEWPVRLTHWMTALSLSVLFASGLYIANPVLAPNGEAAFHFVMGRVREIHFAAAYVLLFSFLVRSYWFWVGNNYARSGFPFVWRRSWWLDLRRQGTLYLGLERGRVHLGHNALAGLAYTTFVIFLGWADILTGFALYSESKPGGFWDRMLGWIIPLLGGSYQARMWHHMLAWTFVVFLILHLYIVFFDSHQYKNGLISSIISGYKFYEKGDIDVDRWTS